MTGNDTNHHRFDNDALDRVFSVTKQHYEELWHSHNREFLRFLRKFFFVAFGLISILLSIFWFFDRSAHESFLSLLLAALMVSAIFTVGFALFYAQSFTLRNQEPETEEGAKLIAANAARLNRLKNLCLGDGPFCIVLREFGGEKVSLYVEGSANMDGFTCAFPEQECENQILRVLAGSIDRFKFHDSSSIFPNNESSLLFPDSIWKDAFWLLVERAALVIAIVDWKPGDNLLWELSYLAESAPEKTVVLCSPHERQIIPKRLIVFDWERPREDDFDLNSSDLLNSAACQAQKILRRSGYSLDE